MKFTVERKVPFSKDKVWKVLEEFGDVYKVNPVVKKSKLLGPTAKGIGAVRQCEFYDGNSVNEKVIEWNEGNSLKLELFGGSMPITKGFGEIKLVNAGRNQTYLIAEVDMTMKWGIFGVLMGIMMKPMMKSMFKKVFKSYEDHLTTGKYIGEKGILLEKPA